jgi:dipeptidyl-peptidase-4
MHYLYFPANTKEFFWKSERSGWSHIYRYNYAGKLLNPVTKGEWEVIKIVHMDYSNRLVYYTSTEASPLERHLYVIGFDGKGKRRITTIPGYHQINFGGEYFFDTYSSVKEPKQVDLVTKDGKLVSRLVSNETAKSVLNQKQYAYKELDRFTTGDGQAIDISIIKPMNFDPAKKYPLLLDVYGGPEHQSVYNQFATDGWHQYLAQLGFVVVEVNNRGGVSYGSKFKNAVYEKLGHYECYDFAEAANYLKTKDWIDGSNIFIQGHSYGGFTSAYSIVTYPDLYKAAIIASPVTDWRNYDAIYTERFMGLLPENKAIYDQQSVLDKVAKIKAKVLIVHSTGDDNVHVKNSMQLLAAMNTIGKDAEVRLYQQGGHGVAHNWESYKLLLNQYTEFLLKNIRN